MWIQTSTISVSQWFII